jgi:excisionase family DNA binding protein
MVKEETIITDVLTSLEAAAYLKTSKQSLLKMVREGKIRANRIGRNYRFSRKELDRFVLGIEQSSEED